MFYFQVRSSGHSCIWDIFDERKYCIWYTEAKVVCITHHWSYLQKLQLVWNTVEKDSLLRLTASGYPAIRRGTFYSVVLRHPGHVVREGRTRSTLHLKGFFPSTSVKSSCATSEILRSIVPIHLPGRKYTNMAEQTCQQAANGSEPLFPDGQRSVQQSSPCIWHCS